MKNPPLFEAGITWHIGPAADMPDWSRERKRFFEWNPAKSMLAAMRAHARAKGLLRKPLRAWAVLRHKAWSVICGAEIPITTRIGGGLVLPHPNGIVIHREAVIGPNCLILQQVTIGQLAVGGVPHIGGHVDIGAGARVLGDVTIGDHASIGANAVVRIDVPPGATAVGVPAVVKRPKAVRSIAQR